MSLRDMTLQDALTLTGAGSNVTFADDGVTIPNGLHLICTSDSSFESRKVVTFKNRPATVDAKTGYYTKDKKSASISLPLILNDGKVVFNVIRIEREIHPQLDANQVDMLNILACQILKHADTNGFWGTGSLT